MASTVISENTPAPEAAQLEELFWCGQLLATPIGEDIEAAVECNGCNGCGSGCDAP
jgi:hypothetical protein